MAEEVDVEKQHQIDERLGFHRYQEGPEKLGWLVNIQPTTVSSVDKKSTRSAVDLYFLEEDGEYFKCTLAYDPYFYVICKPGTESDVDEYLRRKFERIIQNVVKVQKTDLHQPNHLVEPPRTLLKLIFRNTQEQMQVRRELEPIIRKNKARAQVMDTYTTMLSSRPEGNGARILDPMDCISDMREYDVPYYVRVTIDNNIRVGLWYNIKALPAGELQITPRPDLVKRAEPIVLAFDIETTKLPLKFPDAAFDMVMMISYMVDGQGYLITNREIVSSDIEDFEYTPKPEYEGPFIVFNEKNEKALLRRFFEHFQEVKPTVIATYNGDAFDWPFVEARAIFHGLDMFQEIGFFKDSSDEYKSRAAIHMDCYRWVKRDSYLPAGSHGLKAVTTAKLGYNPMELDPEDMTPYAAEKPQVLAQYSVSDAVATYYLYMKYVHPFIFSLCNIIPLIGDEVLRKGSGTLCEMLLMVEAYEGNIIMPNKHVDPHGRMFEGHLIESETYVGGHVEALEAGVFRSDIPESFKVVPAAVQRLMDEVDAALRFSIEEEAQKALSDVTNYDEVRDAILTQLTTLRDAPVRTDPPLIYHLDVAAMYPNIILTNRLQPDALVDEATCARCDFNVPGKTCDRRMTWAWRGEYYPAQRNEYNMIRNQLETETFVPNHGKKDGAPRRFRDLSAAQQAELLQARLGEYSRKVYKKTKESRVVSRESIICQRENPFYVDTVRNFRDRRYEYKGMHKTWKGKCDEATDAAALDEAKKMVVLYDSLQLAHKCILNSFYGYVMRKGSRWYSMEMAGIVCLTGATLIQMARQLVEQIGRPLELDTDGIWCILPAAFPENFTFQLRNGKKLPISYPCVMLNHLVHAQFTNHQYHELTDPTRRLYRTRSENSIFFEVDGPYRAMILPASTEADKLLKKRYAVFNHDGSLAELKGFEVKRRGELKLIKIFQSQIFRVFLDGTTLAECYAAVARLANQWLDILYGRGATLHDTELFELISENRSMSKSLAEYGAQKSTSISTARRLAEFLGDQVVKDKGLSCQFIISARPAGLPVSERAIPIAIFSAEPSIRKHYLRKWLRDPGLQDMDIRGILDWNYYMERFGSVIQKLITIPAAMQRISNPVPRVKHPDWLAKRVAILNDKHKQRTITDMFRQLSAAKGTALEQGSGEDGNEVATAAANSTHPPAAPDLEDFGRLDPAGASSRGTARPAVSRKRARSQGGAPQLDLSGLPDPTTVPRPDEDYAGWLAYAKLKWRRQAQHRAALRHYHQDQSGSAGGPVTTDAGAGPGPKRAALGLGSYFGRTRDLLASAPWQIVQVVPTDVPGVLRAWILVNRAFHAVQLEVPRTFYVNSRVPNPAGDAAAAYVTPVRSLTLPRSQPCHHLYRFTMPEAVFHQHSKSFRTLFSHPGILGVYETQVEPVYRFLLTVGCTSAVTSAGQSLSAERSTKGAEPRFHVDQLMPSVGVIRPNHGHYLDPRRIPLHYVYLFHSRADTRGVFTVINPSAGTADIFVGDGDRGRLQVPNLETLYAERVRAAGVPTDAAQLAAAKPSADAPHTGFSFAYPPSLTIRTELAKSDASLAQLANSALHRALEANRGPTMVVLHSAVPADRLTMTLPALREAPYLTMPFHRSDRALPVLDWQRYVTRRLVGHFLNVSQWVHERTALARYADAPVGNIEPDPALFLSDLFLARKLVSQGVVLWWSSSRRPDLGGHEEDEHGWLGDMGNQGALELSHPGLYPGVCVEIEVGNLAVNTVLASHLIHELEGGALDAAAPSRYTLDATVGDDPGPAVATESSASAALPLMSTGAMGDAGTSPQVFQLLRSLVRGWYTEVARHRYASETSSKPTGTTEPLAALATRAQLPPKARTAGPVTAAPNHYYAEIMTQHFYHWLTHPGSKLYDPCLYALVQGLMRKVLLQLLAELRRLGARVVFASFQKIIVATSKVTRTAAAAYTQYLLKTVTAQPLFDQIDLNPVEVWDRLLWMDPANFGGVLSTTTTVTGGPGRADADESAPSAGGQKIEMSWNLREYLPPAIQNDFELLIAEFIYALHTHHAKQRGDAASLSVAVATEAEAGEVDPEGTAGPRENEPENTPIEDPTFARTLVGQRLTRKLFRLIPEIHAKCAPLPDAEPAVQVAARFPRLPGSYLPLTNPALEFIKSACAVLGLVDGAAREVRVMKRNALDLIGIREFSPEAVFHNPSQSLQLPQVICEYCHYCRDLDFCRDADLLPVAVANPGPNAPGFQSRPWLCVACRHEYDRAGIELALVQLLLRRVQVYQLQDLRCSKCRMVKAENLRSHCPACAAPFVSATITQADLLRQVSIFRNVARFHQLPLLTETAEWILQNETRAAS